MAVVSLHTVAASNCPLVTTSKEEKTYTGCFVLAINLRRGTRSCIEYPKRTSFGLTERVLGGICE